jgi:molybdopterin-guanine dinucleotide biosynthesis protein MobB
MRIAISGFSGSGKTTFITNLIKRLADDYSVLVIKETQTKRVDVLNKDTYRYREAGATASILLTKDETALFTAGRWVIDDLMPLVRTDVVFLEGFKQSHHPKIWLGEGNGPNVVLHNPSLAHAERYIRKQIVIEQLPGLNCGDCGHFSCAELAGAIVEGCASLQDCNASEAPSVTVEIDGVAIPLKLFVKKFIAGTIRGMLSSLHDVDTHSSAHISITISSCHQ